MAILVVAACGPLEPNEEGPPPGISSVSYSLSSINCTQSTATGYSSGSPFTIKVVTVDGKKVEVKTANAYYVMAKAASKAGVNLKVVSGFRTMSSQTYLYNCYKNCNCNNCNLAAKPGYSNHQSGHALDLNTSASGVYSWLLSHAGTYGFKKTVASEKWHWEWWGGGPGGGPCGGGGSSGGDGNWYGESCSLNSQCQSGQCFINASPGFPGGMCSEICTDLCPDAAGETSTFCTSYDGSYGLCHAKCNYSKFFATGCRSGYSCVTMPRYNQPSVTAEVCVPDHAADDGSGDNDPGDNDPGDNGSGSENGWIGDSCSSNSQCEHNYCLAESTFSFPDGMCTKSCSKLCPDKSGETITFCISYDGSEGLCHARCDYDKHPQTGCRSSYTCKKMPRFNQSSVQRNVCVPEGKADMLGGEPDAEGDLPNPEDMDSLEAGCSLGAQGSASGLPGLPGLVLILFGFLVAARRRR